MGDLQTKLALLNFPFHVIGISETRENFDTGFKINVDLDGSIPHSQPSFVVFYDQISQFINCYAPHKKVSKHEIKLSTKPWITKDILAKIRYRGKLYSRMMKSEQPDPNLFISSQEIQEQFC